MLDPAGRPTCSRSRAPPRRRARDPARHARPRRRRVGGPGARARRGRGRVRGRARPSSRATRSCSPSVGLCCRRSARWRTRSARWALPVPADALDADAGGGAVAPDAERRRLHVRRRAPPSRQRALGRVARGRARRARARARRDGIGQVDAAAVCGGLLRRRGRRPSIDGAPLDAARARAARRARLPEPRIAVVRRDRARRRGVRPAQPRRSPESARARRAAALAAVGLPPTTFGERSPFTLSGGEARRAAIAGVLAMRPRYLLLDEPTAGLDAARSRTRCATIVRASARAPASSWSRTTPRSSSARPTASSCSRAAGRPSRARRASCVADPSPVRSAPGCTPRTCCACSCSRGSAALRSAAHARSRAKPRALLLARRGVALMSIPVPFGQYVPVDSPVHRLEPRAKIGLVAGVHVMLFPVDGFAGSASRPSPSGRRSSLSRVPLRLALRGVRAVSFLLALHGARARAALAAGDGARPHRPARHRRRRAADGPLLRRCGSCCWCSARRC